MISRRSLLDAAGGALALTAAGSVPAWSGGAEALLSPLLPAGTRAEAVLDTLPGKKCADQIDLTASQLRGARSPICAPPSPPTTNFFLPLSSGQHSANRRRYVETEFGWGGRQRRFANRPRRVEPVFYKYALARARDQRQRNSEPQPQGPSPTMGRSRIWATCLGGASLCFLRDQSGPA